MKAAPHVLLVTILSAALCAQTPKPAVAIQQDLDKLKKDFPSAKITTDQATGLPVSIQDLKTSPTKRALKRLTDAEAVEQVKNLLRGKKALFALEEPQKNIKIVATKADPIINDRLFVRVQQTIKDVDIFGAQTVVEVDKRTRAMNVTYGFVQESEVNTEPKLSPEQAISMAREARKKRMAVPAMAAGVREEAEPKTTADLVVFDPRMFHRTELTGLKLSYLVSIGDVRYFIDAQSGALLFHYSNVRHLRTRRIYDAENKRVICGPLVREENRAANPLTDDARLAFDNLGSAYDYYHQAFQRSSYNNKSGAEEATLDACVRYGMEQNANWSPAYRQFIFGPGYAVALDITGHEYTHAVVEAEANLLYLGESGAVDESLADFFGTMIEFSKGAGNWTLAESLPGFGPPHAPLRNMADPPMGLFDAQKSFDFDSNYGQPDHYSRLVKPSDPICSGRDNECVHFNSGILNKGLFFLAQDNGGVGKQKAEAMVYWALPTLTPTVSLRAAAGAIVTTCWSLKTHNKYSIVEADCQAASDAFRRVGLQ